MFLVEHLCSFFESSVQSTSSFLVNFIVCVIHAEMEDWMICGLGVASLLVRLPPCCRFQRILSQRGGEQKVSEKWCQVLLITELLPCLCLYLDKVDLWNWKSSELDVLLCVNDWVAFNVSCLMADDARRPQPACHFPLQISSVYARFSIFSEDTAITSSIFIYLFICTSEHY